MVWAGLAAGCVGFVVGLRFKVAMILALGILVVVGTMAAAILFGWTVRQAIATAAVILTIQQCAYLAGLLVSTWHSP